MIYGDDSLHAEHFDSHLATGDLSTRYARTGFLGFVRRTELTQSDGGTVHMKLINRSSYESDLNKKTV